MAPVRRSPTTFDQPGPSSKGLPKPEVIPAVDLLDTEVNFQTSANTVKTAGDSDNQVDPSADPVDQELITDRIKPVLKGVRKQVKSMAKQLVEMSGKIEKISAEEDHSRKKIKRNKRNIHELLNAVSVLTTTVHNMTIPADQTQQSSSRNEQQEEELAAGSDQSASVDERMDDESASEARGEDDQEDVEEVEHEEEDVASEAGSTGEANKSPKRRKSSRLASVAATKALKEAAKLHQGKRNRKFTPEFREKAITKVRNLMARKDLTVAQAVDVTMKKAKYSDIGRGNLMRWIKNNQMEGKLAVRGQNH